MTATHFILVFGIITILVISVIWSISMIKLTLRMNKMWEDYDKFWRDYDTRERDRDIPEDKS